MSGVFYAPYVAPAVGRYWIGGTGNWSDTTHWSATTGGSGGESVPTATDDVYINRDSGFSSGGTLTVDAAANCKNFSSAVRNNYTIFGKGDHLTIAGISDIESGLTFIEGYDETHYDTVKANYGNNITGQSFKGNGSYLTTCTFYLAMTYVWDIGLCYARLYKHTGTYGVDGKIDGELTGYLAQSNGVSTAGFPKTPQTLTTFTFATPYKMNHGVPYIIALTCAGGSSTYYIKFGVDTLSGSPGYSGNFVNEIEGNPVLDGIFYVNGTTV
jgi:hypothetical protein